MLVKVSGGSGTAADAFPRRLKPRTIKANHAAIVRFTIGKTSATHRHGGGPTQVYVCNHILVRLCSPLCSANGEAALSPTLKANEMTLCRLRPLRFSLGAQLLS